MDQRCRGHKWLPPSRIKNGVDVPKGLCHFAVSRNEWVALELTRNTPTFFRHRGDEVDLFFFRENTAIVWKLAIETARSEVDKATARNILTAIRGGMPEND